MDKAKRIITAMVVSEIGTESITLSGLKEVYQAQKERYNANTQLYDMAIDPSVYFELANSEFCFVMAQDNEEALEVAEAIFGKQPTDSELTVWFRATMNYINKLANLLRVDIKDYSKVYTQMLDLEGVHEEDFYNVCRRLSYDPTDILLFVSDRYEGELFS